MSEWWTYRLADFLLFSPRVYYRLFELNNRSFCPIAVVSLALGLVIFYRLLRPIPRGHRIIPAILGVIWIWISWTFFWERYASITWASVYLAPLFALQGVVLLWAGAAGKIKFAPHGGIPDAVAIALFCFSLIGYPLLAACMGRPLLAAEIFGLAPDPTALATLALLVLADNGVRWPLLIVPAMWCLMSGLTLWVMEAVDFFVPPAGAIVALGVAVIRSRQGLLPAQHR